MWQEHGVVVGKSVRAAICLGMVLASVRVAHADPKAAEALFQAGKEAMARGDVATACARFQESFRLDAAPGTLLNVGDCEVRRGHVATAWQAFHDALSLLPPGDFRATYAEEHAASLKSRVPSVRLSVDPRAREPRVFLDGVELGAPSLGVRLPLDPGEHHVVVRGRDQSETESSFVMTEGEARELVAPAGKDLEKRPAPAREQASPGSGRKAATFAAFGVGFAGVFVGAITGLLALNEASRYRAHCDGSGCDAEGLAAATQGRRMATASTIAFVAGGLGLGVGVVLLATQSSGAVGVGGRF